MRNYFYKICKNGRMTYWKLMKTTTVVFAKIKIVTGIINYLKFIIKSYINNKFKLSMNFVLKEQMCIYFSLSQQDLFLK